MAVVPSEKVDLADPGVEPTDEQLNQVMNHVAEIVRNEESLFAKHDMEGTISAMADQLVARLQSGEN